jgi:hypothetical protein
LHRQGIFCAHCTASCGFLYATFQDWRVKSSSLLSLGHGKRFGVLTMFRPDLRTILHARTMTAFRICRGSLGYTDRFSLKRLGWHLWAPGSSTLSSFVCFAACISEGGNEWMGCFFSQGRREAPWPRPPSCSCASEFNGFFWRKKLCCTRCSGSTNSAGLLWHCSQLYGTDNGWQGFARRDLRACRLFCVHSLICFEYTATATFTLLHLSFEYPIPCALQPVRSASPPREAPAAQ